MYADPRHLKRNEIKVRLDDDLYQLLEATAHFRRTQKAVLARDVLEAWLSSIVENDTKENSAA